MKYDPLYVQFIHHFNVTQDFYECHEVMEELWLEEGRDPVYQGLLQVAVGLYHHDNDNESGAIKLMEAGIEKLSGCEDAERLGIDLVRLLEQSRHYLVNLHQRGLAWSYQPFPIVILDTELEQLVAALHLYDAEEHDHSNR
ncbi:DUF309 domain-containing protein [Marinicrinis sediminis]|uniref:DUF309 domain-containing protein n=1 Tax=Marinicrinis sediminis TaxID=1652465 RepID=A0ABW5RAN3_9BACL